MKYLQSIYYWTNNLLGNNVNTVIFYDGYWWISCLIHRNWRSISPSVLRTSGDIASQFLWMSAWYSPISIIKNDSILSLLLNTKRMVFKKIGLKKIQTNSVLFYDCSLATIALHKLLARIPRNSYKFYCQL